MFHQDDELGRVAGVGQVELDGEDADEVLMSDGSKLLDLFLCLLEFLAALAGGVVRGLEGVYVEFEGLDVLQVVADRLGEVYCFETD